MATKVVKVSNQEGFVNAMHAYLNQYSADVAAELETIIYETARECAAKIRYNAQNAINIENGKPLNGHKYADSWSVKTLGKSAYSKSAVVYSRDPYYRLAHLLEYGHACRNGGRAGAYPHIFKAANEIEGKLFKRVEESVKRNAK